MITKLRQIREKSNMTQQDLARTANISVRSYQKVEKGEQIPSVTTAMLIAKTLDTTVEDLFASGVITPAD